MTYKQKLKAKFAVDIVDTKKRKWSFVRIYRNHKWQSIVEYFIKNKNVGTTVRFNIWLDRSIEEIKKMLGDETIWD